MIPLRHLLRSSRGLVPSMRSMSGKSGSLVELTVGDDEIAILKMQRPPVNSLNLDLLQALSKSLDEVQKNQYMGLILTSASPTVFSAGLDIMEMYKADLKRAAEFWGTLQDVWLKLYGSGFITAAAINGHAPAGGCLLAMSCEYRVMVGGKFGIGLNETALGIVAPPWFMDTMRNVIPVRQAELALTLGKMFSVEEALKVGLIDEVASDAGDAESRCRAFVRRYERIPPGARAHTKLTARARELAALRAARQQDTDLFLKYIADPQVQQGLEMYIHMMKQKAAKK